MHLKIILIGALFLGSFFLIGCGKQSNQQDAFEILEILKQNTENSYNIVQENHSNSSDSSNNNQDNSSNNNNSSNNCNSNPSINILKFDKVTEAPGSGSGNFSDPTKAINGVFGCGKTCGSLDVYSLKSSSSTTYCKPNEKCMVLEIQNKIIKNGVGVDFVVFENGFCIGGTANCGISHFMEPVVVEVSYDGINWCGWNPQFLGNPSDNASKNNPTNWKRFAGIEPVVYNQNTWTLTEEEIFDKTKAGGDGFDLSDSNFGLSGDGCTIAVKDQILCNGFIYLRLTTSFSRGFPLTSGSFDQASDIDGVIAKYVLDR